MFKDLKKIVSIVVIYAFATTSLFSVALHGQAERVKRMTKLKQMIFINPRMAM